MGAPLRLDQVDKVRVDGTWVWVLAIRKLGLNVYDRL